eukprot:EG_transcript_33314
MHFSREGPGWGLIHGGLTDFCSERPRGLIGVVYVYQNQPVHHKNVDEGASLGLLTIFQFKPHERLRQAVKEAKRSISYLTLQQAQLLVFLRSPHLGPWRTVSWQALSW